MAQEPANASRAAARSCGVRPSDRGRVGRSLVTTAVSVDACASAAGEQTGAADGRHDAGHTASGSEGSGTVVVSGDDLQGPGATVASHARV